MDRTDLRLLVNIIETESMTRGGDRSFLPLPAASPTLFMRTRACASLR